MQLPPGQRERNELPRFGLQWFAFRKPLVPRSALLEVDGVPLTPDSLAALPRVEQTSDFHCTTTWSVRGLRWSGVRFRDFWEQLVMPTPGSPWLLLHGLDGYRTTMLLQDALAEDVLLADHLNGTPLTRAHGAPLRLVAPAQYGWKSVKGLQRITRHERRPWMRSSYLLDHPRGRVALEERGTLLPAAAFRALYPTAGPPNRMAVPPNGPRRAMTRPNADTPRRYAAADSRRRAVRG